jgi:PLP dependent protein
VSKGFGAAHVRAAVEAGLATLGENRVQEAAAKIPAVRGAAWHLIGPLQSNKARRAVELFDLIESVDSVELAARLDRLVEELRPDRPLPILLQVNVDADPGKAGFDPAVLEGDLARLADLPALRLEGLMTVGRLVDRPSEARPTFVALRTLRDRLRGREPRLGPELSMGMSADYDVAIEEGASIVRIGRALFGDRPAAR